MKEFTELRQDILNHLSQLTFKEKQDIQKKLYHLEEHLSHLNQVFARHQLACILTIALSLIPAPITSEIAKSVVPYLYIISLTEKYFPYLGISLDKNITLDQYKELKAAILGSNYNYQQTINIFERYLQKIDSMIKKYNSTSASVGGILGFTGGRLFSKVKPLSYFGIVGSAFIPFIASNLSLVIVPELFKNGNHINNPQIKHQANNQGLSANDILITIRHYMTSGIDGFDSSLREIASAQSKKEFITKCMYLVDNGWNNVFISMFSEENPDDYYFYAILKKLLFQPLQDLFANRPDLSPQSTPAIAFFTRLQLYKLLFEVAKHDKTLVDKNWLKEAKNRLDNEFTKLATSYPVNYNGRILKDAADIQSAILSAHQSKSYYNDYILPMYYTFAGVYCLYQYFLHTIPIEIQIGVLLLTLIIDHYYKQSLNASSTAKQFLNQDLPAQRKQQEIISDRNILKFFHVSQCELDELDRPVFQP
jgi:hypothetical protein